MKQNHVGSTWWSEAWIAALEDRALAEPNRLGRGRTYARQNRVRNVEIEPGLLRAEVEGTNEYITHLSVASLSADVWEELFDLIVTEAKLSASLLAGEVPHALGEHLLPGPGELTPDCTCPDDAEPCKHSAALCFVAADIFDRDPFALLLLRGKNRQEILDELRARRAALLGVEVDLRQAHWPRGIDPGTSASAAFRRRPQPLGRSIVAPAAPRTLPRLAVSPPTGAGIDQGELRQQVADAARRAHAMLAGDATSQLDLSVGADVARRSIAGDVAAIAEATDLPIEDLAAAAKAFYYGGQDGLAIANRRWDPDPNVMAPGVAALSEFASSGQNSDRQDPDEQNDEQNSEEPDSGGHGPVGNSPKVRANTVSLGPIQLRIDQQSRWWRFDSDDDLGWLLSGPAAMDPADLMT